MKIFDCLSIATRVALFVGFMPNASATPKATPTVEGNVVVVNANKGGRGPVATVTPQMQKEAFKKGGFYRVTVTGKVEFVKSASIAARVAARVASDAQKVVEGLLVEFFCDKSKQARLVRKEVRKGVMPTQFDKNGVRFI